MDVPTNLVSLALFVVLLAPGLVSITWRRFRPIRRPTVLGELAGLVFRSLICDILAFGVFALIHVLWPQWTFDFGALIRTRTLRAYLRENYAFAAWWSLGLLALACLFAYLGAQIWAILTNRNGRFYKLFEKLVPGDVIAYQPAWWEMFSAYKGHQKWVDCVLDDDTYLSGVLHSYSPDPNETDDRELTLVGAIRVKLPGDTTEYPLKGVGGVCISARRIRYLTVTYLPNKTKRRRCAGAMRAALRSLRLPRLT
jgi:hypothetical protein